MLPTTEERTSLPAAASVSSLPCLSITQVLLQTRTPYLPPLPAPMFCAGVQPSPVHPFLGILLLPCSALLTNNPTGCSWQNQLIFLASQHLAAQTVAQLFMKVKLQMAHPHPLDWQVLLFVLDMAAVEKREHPPTHSSNPSGLGRASHVAAKCRVCGLCWAGLDR